jgi:hypothetical protein
MDLEEISWRQKSRTVWLKEGDRNSKFFHRLANPHRRNNLIGTLSIDGNTTSDSEEIKDGVVNFYEKLYTKSVQWRPKLDGLSFNGLTDSEA